MADSAGAGGTPVSDRTTTNKIATASAQADAAATRLDPRDPNTGKADIHTFPAAMARILAATDAAGGGGFELTPDQLQTQLARCQQTMLSYLSAIQGARDARSVLHAPAPDTPGSMLHADQTDAWLGVLAGVIDSQTDFLAHWEKTLVDVRTNYLRNEHLTEDQWQRLAGG